MSAQHERRWHAEQRADLRRRQREAAAPPPAWTVDLLHVEAPDWREVAACRGADPEMFFPERGESTRDAKAVCESCPVTIECLGYALDHGEKLGIWGGLSERQRRSHRSSWVRR